MDQRVFRILEFDKIIVKLSSYATCSLGKELIDELLPQTNFDLVESSLKETSDAASYVARRGSPPMGGIHDIRDSLRRVDMGGILNPGELLRIADTLRACRNLKGYANDNRIDGSNSNIVGELIGALETNRRIEDKISFSILSEEEIADNASPTLANLRRKMKDLQGRIKDKLNDIIKSTKYQKVIQDSLVTMRGDRYVIPVKQENRNDIPGLVHDSSSSGATIYIEPIAVVEANNDIKQCKIKEQQEIERILSELTAEVATISPQLNSNISILTRLDFVFAKARLSLDLNCVCPQLNKHKEIIIKKGRHPLLDKKIVVPVDFWIGKDFNTLVVTGPNTGGKTVTLKTVGLFTLMVQAGLHIPANEGTQMSIFQKVFADIGDEQSIEQSLSTFSSHMKNIVDVLENVDDSSLVLFDELGSGTDPTEGSALAMAILENLHQVGAITLATTHYSELKVYAVTTKGVENACCEFNIDTLRPTYRLLIGVPGKSNAFAISNRLGLPEVIINRAREFLSQDDVKFEDMLLSIEKNRNQAEEEKTKAKILRLEIEKLKSELDNQKDKISEQKEKILREAREEAKKIYIEAKDDADSILGELRKLEEEKDAKERNKLAHEMSIKLKSKANKAEELMYKPLVSQNGSNKKPVKLKPGDSVLIVDINQKGTVLTLPDNNGDAMIQAGIMKINVNVRNLKLISEDTKAGVIKGAAKFGASRSKVVKQELDLRGYALDEALDLVDKYLDDVYIAGLHEVMIIHGKGTGVLRSGVQQYLRSHSHVKAFRLGKYGEGEAGVTVVELK